MMKKKILIKESELEQFVKNFLSEEQLEIEFPKDTITEMLEEKYEEIVKELKSAIESGDIDKLDEIYDTKIFDLTKVLHKVPKNMEIVTKFNELEDSLIDYIELYKQHLNLKQELDKSLEDLESLF